MVMRPYFVFSPPFSVASAGIIVMHRLANELRLAGMEVYINTPVQNPRYGRIPLIESHQDMLERIFSGVAIYPEIVWGNPFACRRVVRYLLNIPGFFGGPLMKDFDEKDLVYILSDEWNELSGLNLPKNRILEIPSIDITEFKNWGLPRTGSVFFFGKRTAPEPVHPSDSVFLGRKESFTTPESRLKLIERLNAAETFYSYDSETAMNDIASLCGCKVVLIEDGILMHENKIKDEEGTRNYLLDREANLARQLADFIKTTQEMK